MSTTGVAIGANSDPRAAALERWLNAVFGRIHAGPMADLPILNPALRVEALGFRSWEGQWLGALLTPWCMNLMLLPGSASSGSPPPPGSKRVVELPSGAYEFTAGRERGIGPYEACSLFSPVTEFVDQEAAVATARAALRLLYEPIVRDVDLARRGVSARSLSRRDLLHGAFLGLGE